MLAAVAPSARTRDEQEVFSLISGPAIEKIQSEVKDRNCCQQ